MERLRDGMAGLVAWVRATMPDREIIVRAGGEVRFVRVSGRAQMLAAGAAALLLLIMVSGSALVLWRMARMSAVEGALARQESAVSTAAAHVSAQRRSVDAVVDDMEARQSALESLVERHFGEEAAPAQPQPQPTSKGKKISAAAPLSPAERLSRLRARQVGFTARLEMAARGRIGAAEARLRGFGLNPARLASGGQGGPFIPAADAVGLSDAASMPMLRRVADLLDRLDRLESALEVLPSGQPTASPMMTSSYGYRRDPFNGLPAFHAGVDFPGRYGQPILAAAEGRVIFAGQRSGYGNCLEIDHGHGIVTRYAHLSSFVARPGMEVARGTEVGRMGSTGRSTGTHLHFEVRINGAAVDPRPFLRESQNVVENRQVGRGARHGDG